MHAARCAERTPQMKDHLSCTLQELGETCDPTGGRLRFVESESLANR
jgi:hypothetical protein